MYIKHYYTNKNLIILKNKINFIQQHTKKKQYIIEERS